MPGSAYHRVAKKIAALLALVPECQINSSTQKVSAQLKDIHLQPEECLISLDVVSLYTNVPVRESIQVCADLLFDTITMTSMDKETFIVLAELACCNVVFSTHRGYFTQVDGLAMGSPPAPQLANGWLSRYESTIKANSCLYERYMDDILCSINKNNIDERLDIANKLHPNLKFTVERENNGKLSFLDMVIFNNNGSLSSGWFRKDTDTGLTLNFNSLAPMKYKKSVVTSFVYRIFRACSNWEHFHKGLSEATDILCRNQYPDSFIFPIIKTTIDKLVNTETDKDTDSVDVSITSDSDPDVNHIPEKDWFKFFVTYRGKPTDQLAMSFKKLNCPVKLIMTTRKLKTCLPSLKSPVPKMLLSNVVYKLKCPGCSSSYVGQTVRHMQRRFREHVGSGGTLRLHFEECNTVWNSTPESDIVQILDKCNSVPRLMALEALYIKDIKPDLNTKDEFRSRTLTLKLY